MNVCVSVCARARKKKKLIEKKCSWMKYCEEFLWLHATIEN